jgi:hypothetical protein
MPEAYVLTGLVAVKFVSRLYPSDKFWGLLTDFRGVK